MQLDTIIFQTISLYYYMHTVIKLFNIIEIIHYSIPFYRLIDWVEDIINFL